MPWGRTILPVARSPPRQEDHEGSIEFLSSKRIYLGPNRYTNILTAEPS